MWAASVWQLLLWLWLWVMLWSCCSSCCLSFSNFGAWTNNEFYVDGSVNFILPFFLVTLDYDEHAAMSIDLKFLTHSINKLRGGVGMCMSVYQIFPSDT